MTESDPREPDSGGSAWTCSQGHANEAPANFCETCGQPKPSTSGGPATVSTPNGGKGRARIWLAAVIVVLLLAVLGVGVAALTRSSSTVVVTTSTTQSPTSIATTTPPTTVPPATTTPATSPPATTPAISSAAPCDDSLLFQAAVQKEGFNPNDPSYAQLSQTGQGAGASGAVCVDGWAMANVSRPNVGTTDGDTLFESSGGTWMEVSDIGAPWTSCTLEGQGVPASVAPTLTTDFGGTTVC